ncbi:ATP synthase subunit 5, mitochondrial precursor [Aspergillus terreus NIH2624]|uniref:ATP synthase subunit 5, mitochondrial n=1 Tax=Aspergillus terreus (strain NIH 2624 / FGSC A1156) TaxID=341663 RepID=Q0CYR1_ASPTN|nr:ATP synthase subunit 5, mitochondrial precursor [Aspergillus terreus NIH2624]EAU37930.1 ATP synthase subunit 5, mitochondrial precursor [Aspergillus terreus NIH2624]
MLSARVARAGFRATQFSVPRTAALNGLRAYATPAQDVKPPVSLFGVDGTYATALYTAAAKSSALDQTSKALANLGQVLKADRKLTGLISAPTLTAGDKQQIVQELAKLSGDKGEIVQNFLTTLGENNRLGLLEGVCEKFETLMGAHRGEIELNITSAQVALIQNRCRLCSSALVLTILGTRQEDHLPSREGRRSVRVQPGQEAQGRHQG